MMASVSVSQTRPIAIRASCARRRPAQVVLAQGKGAQGRTAAAGPKRSTAAELLAEVERLRQENEVLRRQLAGMSEESVQAASVSAAVTAPPSTVRAAPVRTGSITDTWAAPDAPLAAPRAAPGAAAPPAATAPAVIKPPAAAPAVAPAVAPTDFLEKMEAGINWPKPEEGSFWERPPRDVPMPLTPPGGAAAAVQKDPRAYHVVHITAEMAPIAKVGGLGDVVTGLARACLTRGHKVEIMLPFYESLPQDAIEDLQHVQDFDCPKGKTWDGEFQSGKLRTQVYTGKIEGCPVILLRPDWGQCNLFQGGKIYGGSYNEAEAYLYFSRACLEWLKLSGSQPDVLHVHEWQASAVPMLFWDAPARFSQHMPHTRCVMTIHNMDSSGECRQDEFAATGVNGELFSSIDKALDERTIGHNPERLCLLKGGVVYSNAVTTVSPNYANETLNGGAAGWLKSTLAAPAVAAKYSGVLNGIDTSFWDPTNDPFLAACYDAGRQQGKALCKRYLQEGLGMTVDPNKPLVAVISRLVPQKGIHLIEHAVHRTVEMGGQFVVLGTGHADGGLRGMAGGQYRDNRDVQMRFTYSEALAHQIYAAADMLLVPSLFEPCGLTQMIALRYGTVPVVRSTGGLADTVKDVDNSWGGGDLQPNGFVFDGINGDSLNSALDRAMRYYRERPEWWAELRGNIISDALRWSWDTAASRYVSIYQEVSQV